ncbi:hypothetical protein [Altererythrobacter sp. MTPC7]|uniref:hypothetical protein n=1 Tax=Altererythrobacter sp. MTPC7 TaxID=3056567 RepID=UPI0036F2EBFC
MKRLCGIGAVLALAACSDPAPEAGRADAAPGAGVETGEVAERPVREVAKTAGVQTSVPPQVACSQSEQTIFSCETSGGRTIAVCGSDGEVQYRFGERLAEIVLTGGRFAQVPYAGGGEAQVAFINGETRYIVFSRIVRTNFEPGEPNHPKITDGVMVVRGGKIVAERICKAETVDSVDVAAGETYGGVSREIFIPD